MVPAAIGTVVNRSEERTALLLAAELLAQHFANDAEVLAALLQDGRPTEGELLALAMGWPGTPQARARFDAALHDRLPLSLDVGARLTLLLGNSEEALEALCSWLLEGESQSRLVAPPTTAALRRTAEDPRFAEALRQRLRESGTPSELGSGARLLPGETADEAGSQSHPEPLDGFRGCSIDALLTGDSVGPTAR